MRPGLLGEQRPRVSSWPKYSCSAGQEAVALAKTAGLELDPWQQFVLEHALGEREDGKWAAFEVGIVVPRQCGKGAILEAIELAGLFLFDEKLILHSAHEFKTASEAFSRVKTLIDNTDQLRKQVSRVRTSHGEEAIELQSGARLRFVARSRGSGRGFSADRVILDEAYHLDGRAMGALLPTLSARPNPQIVYASSAGMENSEQLRNVRERGLAGTSARLAYFEWSADPLNVDIHDPRAWAAANPALGIRLDEEFILSELEALGEQEFKRERLGIWSQDSGSRVISPEDWAEIADSGSRVSGPVVLAIDCDPDGVSGAVSLAGEREDGLGHRQVVAFRPGTAWIPDRVLEFKADYDVRAVLLDPSGPAGALIPALESAGIELIFVSGREMAQACGAFYQGATERKDWRHCDQDALNLALAGAKKRPLADAWAWHRKNSGVNICPLVATTLADHGWALYGQETDLTPMVAVM